MKLRKKIAIGFGGLAALCLTGCTDFSSAFLKTYARTPARDQYAVNRRTLADYTADVLAKEADAQRARMVAEAGADSHTTNLNVYNNQPVNNTQPVNNSSIPRANFVVGKKYNVTFINASNSDNSVFRQDNIVFREVANSYSGNRELGWHFYFFEEKTHQPLGIPINNILSIEEAE